MKVNSLHASVPVLLVAMLAGWASNECHADWPFPLLRPDGAQRIDVIGPVGSRMPESYRRQYNRPTYLGGKTAAIIAPSSQEARAWQRADALGLYDNNGIKGALNGKHCPPQRVEQHYFYPKPWEVLTVGPRRSRSADADDVDRYEEPVLMKEVAQELEEAETLDRPKPDELESILPEPELQQPIQDQDADTLDLNDQSSLPSLIRDPVFVAPVSGLIHRQSASVRAGGIGFQRSVRAITAWKPTPLLASLALFSGEFSLNLCLTNRETATNLCVSGDSPRSRLPPPTRLPNQCLPGIDSDRR